jgi:Protein of unknown function (DUF1257)
MSHLSTVQSQFRDPAALRAAAKALGLELLTGGRARGYGGTLYPEADYLIKLPGPFDLAFRRQADGTYAMECDGGLMRGWYGSEAGMAAIGKDANRLKVEYSFAVLQAEARRKGRQIQRQELPNGRVRVIMSGGR